MLKKLFTMNTQEATNVRVYNALQRVHHIYIIIDDDVDVLFYPMVNARRRRIKWTQDY